MRFHGEASQQHGISSLPSPTSVWVPLTQGILGRNLMSICLRLTIVSACHAAVNHVDELDLRSGRETRQFDGQFHR